MTGNDQRLEAWRRLAAPSAAPLIAEASSLVESGVTPAGVARLRRRHPEAPVAEAIELAEVRRRAARKFPGMDRLLADRAGLEQASGRLVADWKARRFGSQAVLDLCCGIGGDAMALAARGPCIGVDRDPVRTLMTGHNAGIATRTEEIQRTAIDAPLVHVDPARRDEASGRRSWRVDDLVPGLSNIASIVGRAEGGAIKLGPGLPLPPPVLHDAQSLTVVSESGRLVQAIVWTGSLARAAPREAVDLPSGATCEGEFEALPVGEGEIDSVLVEFHPAVERLGLGPGILRAACGDAATAYHEPAAGLGLLTGPMSPIVERVADVPTPWLRVVEIRRVMPARLDRVVREVEAVAASVDACDLVVRTRGRAIDTDRWQAGLVPSVRARNGRGPVIEVGGWRLGRRTVATIGLRRGPDSSASAQSPAGASP